jgi:beta-fructofuranosidase
MTVWNMEDVDVWPERPRNSSSELVFDTAEETNNFVWWPGN